MLLVVKYSNHLTVWLVNAMTKPINRICSTLLSGIGVNTMVVKILMLSNHLKNEEELHPQIALMLSSKIVLIPMQMGNVQEKNSLSTCIKWTVILKVSCYSF